MKALNKKILTVCLVLSMALAMAAPASAAAPRADGFKRISTSNTLAASNRAAANIAGDVAKMETPQVDDLMSAMKSTDSTEIAVGNVDQEIVDMIEDNFSFSGITVLSEVPAANSIQRSSSGEKEFSLNVYQLAEGDRLLTAEEALKVARSRPLSYSYSNGNSTYQVYGTIRANFKYKPGTTTEITFTSVSAMTNWGTSVNRTTKMYLAAKVDVDYGVDYCFADDTFNNPNQSQWYTVNCNFDLYKTIGGTGYLPDSAYAGCTYTMSNGQSFELRINVRNMDSSPYEGYMQ